MLAKGIQLTLLMGPVIPVPGAARGDRRARQRRGDARPTARPSGFQLTFQFTSKSELNTIFLIAARQQHVDRRRRRCG